MNTPKVAHRYRPTFHHWLTFNLPILLILAGLISMARAQETAKKPEPTLQQKYDAATQEIAQLRKALTDLKAWHEKHFVIYVNAMQGAVSACEGATPVAPAPVAPQTEPQK